MKPHELTPKQIGEALDALAQVERMGAAIRAHAIKLLHAGKKIPGYAAAFTTPQRRWVNENDAAGLLAMLGLGKHERYALPALLSPAQAEVALKAKKLWPKKTRGGASEDFTNPLTPVIGYTETKPTLRKISDN